jgi:DNA end-binding protein Ku
MAAAATLFRASLRIGSERVGVRLHSGAREHDVHFHLLHESDQQRIRQRMVNPRTGESVRPDEIVRGVEVERGSYVVLTEHDLETLKPAASRDIRVEHFIEPGSLDPRFYERPYLLGPEGANVQRYFALAQALRNSDRQGIARWTMRNREYNGLLCLEGEHLALITLRNSDELLDLARIHVPAGRDLDAREVALARQLVGALSGPFVAAEFRDEYRERLLHYIEEKARGKRAKLRRFKAKPVEDDALVAALEKSIRRAG